MEQRLRKRTNVNYQEGLCGCNPQNGNNCGKESSCLNRSLNMICKDESCGSGGDCQNRIKPATNSFAIGETITKGKGIFATQYIPAGSFILHCEGRELCISEFVRHADQVSPVKVCAFVLESGKYLDMCDGNAAKYLNHSCTPNAYVIKMGEGSDMTMEVVAIKDIRKDEEITIRYDTKPLGFMCRCEKCKMVGEDI